MFTVKFKDGTTLAATSVEERCRPEYDGKFYTSLIVQNGGTNDSYDLDALKNKLTADALSSVQVFIGTESAKPARTYTGYGYIHYLTARLQPNGTILLDMSFTKENLAV